MSEEDDEAILLESPDGHYVACFDPLDGSSNIDVNIVCKQIFLTNQTKFDFFKDCNFFH